MKKLFSKFRQSDKWKPALMLSCCLLLMSAAICGAGFAAFRASGTGQSGDIRMAAYALSAGATTTGSSLAIDCNTATNNTSYVFWVKNSSGGVITEVSAKYKIEVKLPTTLPSGLTMQLDGTTGTASADGLTYTFTNDAWVFSAGVESTKSHSLTFTADAGVIDSDISLSSIVLTVRTEQID